MGSPDPIDGLKLNWGKSLFGFCFVVNEVEKPIKEESEEENEEVKEEEEKKPRKKTVTRRKATAKRVINDEVSEEKPKRKCPKKGETATKKRSKANTNSTQHISEEVKQNIGKIKALPEKFKGMKINYLPASAGPNESNKVVKLNTIPENTILAIDR